MTLSKTGSIFFQTFPGAKNRFMEICDWENSILFGSPNRNKTETGHFLVDNLFEVMKCENK